MARRFIVGTVVLLCAAFGSQSAQELPSFQIVGATIVGGTGASPYVGTVTVRGDLGSYSENFDAVRHLLRDGTIQGPRMAMASRVSSPGRHGAESVTAGLTQVEGAGVLVIARRAAGDA